VEEVRHPCTPAPPDLIWSDLITREQCFATSTPTTDSWAYQLDRSRADQPGSNDVLLYDLSGSRKRSCYYFRMSRQLHQWVTCKPHYLSKYIFFLGIGWCFILLITIVPIIHESY
jgi:hypothetical protein